MTNLPITTSTPQAATAPNQTPNAAASGDAQSNQPFGEVLARQINDPAAKDAKANDKSGTEALLQSAKDATDNKKAIPVAPDNTAALPTGMLAALMPQAMNTAAISSTKPEISANAAQDKLGVATLKANISAGVQADAANTAAVANRSAQVKEQSFVAAFTESANRTPVGMELNTASHAAITSLAAPKSDAGAIASLQNTAASIAAPVLQPVQLTINAPVTQNKWGDEFSQKITWLASSNKDQTAELHLNPPQLGPLDVVIKVSGDQATALFTSPHAAVRDAIEQAMPKLREMMADNGIMLGNATVSDQTPRDQGQSGAQRSSVSPVSDIRNIPISTGNSTARVSPISRHNGIVDTFA
jgi:flagellar hook-length control protein FliK